MQQALEEASWELNPTGMKVFYEQINMYEKREEYMELLDDGKIKETYNSGDSSYEVDGKSCTCSTFAQYFYCCQIVPTLLCAILPPFSS